MFWQKLLRFVVKGAAYALGIGLLAVGGPLILGAVVGFGGSYVLGRAYDRAIEGSAGRERGVGGVRSRGMGRESFLKLRGWNFNGLPLDMTLDSVDGRTARLGAAGIDSLITAKKSLLGTDAEFSFPLPGRESAMRVNELIEKNAIDARIVRGKDDSLSVVCSSLATANSLAKTAYPKHKAEVTREVNHVLQYVVSGAKDFAEAKAMLEADPECGRLVGSYVSTRDSVNGFRGGEQVSGGPVDGPALGGELPVGSYVVNVCEKSLMKGTLQMPATVVGSDMAAYSADHFDSSVPGATVSGSVDYSDGTPEGLGRYFVHEVSGHHVELRDPALPGVAAEDGLKAYVVFPDSDSLAGIMNAGTLAEGTFVSISKSAPVVGAGKYLLELDMADPRVRDAVSKQVALPASVQVSLDLLGVEPGTIEYSRIVDRVRREGSVGLSLAKGLGEDVLFDARIMGVPFGELSERLCDERMVDLDVDKALQWAKDASEINYVNVEVDVARAELRISSSVGSGATVKTERLPLTDDDIASLSRRGTISRTEMKDLLIQLHPDYFKTYSSPDGRSVFADPMRSFLRGEKPSLISGERKVVTNKLNQPLKPSTRKGTKISL